MNVQKPVTGNKPPLIHSQLIHCSTPSRSVPSRRAVRKHASYTTPSAGSTHELDGQHAADQRPVSFVLPDGRQFQLQFVIRRDGQPEWSFSGLSSLYCDTPTAFVKHTDNHPLHQQQQQHSLAAAAAAAAAGDDHTEDDDNYDDMDLNSDHENDADDLGLLPWLSSETAAATSPANGFAIPAAAVQAAAERLLQTEAVTPPASAAAAAAAAVDAAVQLDDALLAANAGGNVSAAAAAAAEAVDEDMLSATAAAAPNLTEMQSDLQQQQQQQQLDGKIMLLEQMKLALVASTEIVQQQQQQQEEQEPIDMRQQQQQASSILEQQQQQHQSSPSSLTQYLLRRISSCDHIWQIRDAVKRYVRRPDFTAAVAAAALQRLDSLVDVSLVRQLRQGGISHQEAGIMLPGARYGGKQQMQDPAAAAAAAAAAGSRVGSSSSSSSSKRAYQGPVLQSIVEGEIDDDTTAAASSSNGSSSSSSKQRQQWCESERTAVQQLKPLVRVFLRLINVVETHISEVPAAGLIAAARLSARLVGSDNKVYTWWERARGYVVLGEAATRWRAGDLKFSAAVDICYSCHHCGYKPRVLLQPLLADVVDKPEILDTLDIARLCHLTYCATSNMDNVKFKHHALAAAVAQALCHPHKLLHLPRAKPYNLVMVLRHLCQLSSNPPVGLLSRVPASDQQQQQQCQQQQQQCQQQQPGVLLLALLGRMPDMTMQELSTVLHVAVEWKLDCCQQLAAAAAALVAAAAGLSSSDEWQQQQQQWFGAPRLLQQALQEVQQQQQQCDGDHHDQVGDDVAAAAAAAESQQQQQALTTYCETWTAALDASDSTQQQQRRLQSPRTAADPVIFLHRLCQCDVKPPRVLTDWLLNQVGPSLHKITLLQANLLYRTLVYKWEDHRSCSTLLTAGLNPWLVDHPAAAAAAAGSSGDGSSALAAVNSKVFKIPYWQLKSLIVAAGRFGAFAVDNTQQQQQQQQQQQRSSNARGRDAAAAFINGIMQQLQVNSSSSSRGGSSVPTDISAWRADMVLALFWACARLKITPPSVILSAGTAALTMRMRRHISAHEMVHLVWTAAELKMTNAEFLQTLCGFVVMNANKMHPKSIAGAAWSLVQLRCPHTAVLSALSKALLRPNDMNTSSEILRSKTWHRQQQQLHRQQQRWQQRQRLYKESPSQQDLHTWDLDRLEFNTSSSSSSDGSSRSSSCDTVRVPNHVLLTRHPRFNLLGSEHVAKLAAACVMAGWAPPLLLLLLAARAVGLMPYMPPADLSQLMWAYASANCSIPSLLHAAAARSAELAAAAAFSSSKQPLALLGAFRSLGLSRSEADGMLVAEVRRLKAIERQQQQQQQWGDIVSSEQHSFTALCR